MRKTALTIMLLIGAFAVCAPAWAGQSSIGKCSDATLPVAIQKHLKDDFSSWRIQKTNDLSASAKERWVAMKSSSCPGIAAGQFEGSGAAFIVLLVPEGRSNSAYRLVAFSRTGTDETFKESVIERWDGGGASNFFVYKVPLKSYLSESWKRKLHVSTTEGFLFADAGTSEYEIDVYYWSNGKYLHQPVDE